MKMIPALVVTTVATVAVLVTGCKSDPPARFVIVPQSAPFLTSDQRANVWFPDQIAPYAVGRYVDPRDPHVVHEAHILYRREQTSRPNLIPPEALVVPPMAGPSASNTTALALIEQAKSLANSIRQLNSQTQEFRDALQEAARVRAQLQAVSNRLEMLESQLRSIPAGSQLSSPTNASMPLP